MELPEYFNNTKSITVKDELGKFLGSTLDGEFEIRYQDIVKMAGHSCATVAGAYLMTLKGLKALYPNETPNRGDIKVELRDNATEGSVGVSATVFTNITGAAGPLGFGGLGGEHVRKNLLSFNAPIDNFVRFTRLDTGKSVEVKYRPANVVHPSNIMMTALGPQATEESKKAFPAKWQEMVKTLFDKVDEVVEVI
jgi:hypothetical protein